MIHGGVERARSGASNSCEQQGRGQKDRTRAFHHPQAIGAPATPSRRWLGNARHDRDREGARRPDEEIINEPFQERVALAEERDVAAGLEMRRDRQHAFP